MLHSMGFLAHYAGPGPAARLEDYLLHMAAVLAPCGDALEGHSSTLPLNPHARHP